MKYHTVLAEMKFKYNVKLHPHQGGFPDSFNHLSANPTKWLNTLKQLVGNLPTNCLIVFDHFVGLALKWLKAVFCIPNFVLKKMKVVNNFIPIQLF